MGEATQDGEIFPPLCTDLAQPAWPCDSEEIPTGWKPRKIPEGLEVDVGIPRKSVQEIRPGNPSDLLIIQWMFSVPSARFCYVAFGDLSPGCLAQNPVQRFPVPGCAVFLLSVLSCAWQWHKSHRLGSGTKIDQRSMTWRLAFTMLAVSNRQIHWPDMARHGQTLAFFLRCIGYARCISFQYLSIGQTLSTAPGLCQRHVLPRACVPGTGAHLCLGIHIYIYIYICMCIYIYIHTNVYAYVYAYVYVYVYVYVVSVERSCTHAPERNTCVGIYTYRSVRLVPNRVCDSRCSVCCNSCFAWKWRILRIVQEQHRRICKNVSSIVMVLIVLWFHVRTVATAACVAPAAGRSGSSNW